MSVLVLLCAAVSPAFATGPTLGGGLVGQSISDPVLVSAYRPSGLGGRLTASLPIRSWLRAEVEVGYLTWKGHRVYASSGALETGTDWGFTFVPIHLPVLAELRTGRVTLGAGLGPAYVYYAEEQPPDSTVSGSGGKFAAVVQGELRVATYAVERRWFEESGPSGMEVVADIGYRGAWVHVLDPERGGLNLSALTLGVGVELGF